MIDPGVTVAILAFIAFSIPIVGGLWRLFSVRENLNSTILENRHRIELLEQRLLHLYDQQELSIAAIREIVQNLRDSSVRSEEKLNHRIDMMEGFLARTTGFVIRDH